MNSIETLDTISSAIAIPGPGELLLILLIVIVVFGHNRIPQLGEALGKGIKNFRKSFAADETETQAVHKEVRQIKEEPPSDLEKLETLEVVETVKKEQSN